MTQQTMFRTKNGKTFPINQSNRVSPAQRSLPINSQPPEPPPTIVPTPEPQTVYDMATQVREMTELVAAFARSYGYCMTPKAALEAAKIITSPEHRYAFGEFDDPEE